MRQEVPSARQGPYVHHVQVERVDLGQLDARPQHVVVEHEHAVPKRRELPQVAPSETSGPVRWEWEIPAPWEWEITVVAAVADGSLVAYCGLGGVQEGLHVEVRRAVHGEVPHALVPVRQRGRAAPSPLPVAMYASWVVPLRELVP